MTRAFLAIAGALAIGLGLAILLMPIAFYAGYGIEVAGQVSLLNELRSHGLWLAATGGFVAAGVFLPRLTGQSLVVAAGAYLSYAASRLIGAVFDGQPSTGLILAAATEAAIGLIAVLLFARRRSQPAAA